MTPAERFVQALNARYETQSGGAGDPHWVGRLHDVLVEANEIDEREVSIEELRADDQGQGHGTQALEELLALADELGVTLTLFADPGHGGDNERLQRWYHSHDFVTDETDQMGRSWMTRTPRTAAAVIDAPPTLWHGSRSRREELKAGEFLSNEKNGALYYALLGPNQQEDWGSGWLNTYQVVPGATVLQFESFAEAYEFYDVSVEAGATYALAAKAARHQDADFIQIYDEFVLVNPAAISYLTSDRVSPDDQLLSAADGHEFESLASNDMGRKMTLLYRGRKYTQLREAAKGIYYHGTATGEDGELLRKILKVGLDSDPRKRRYEIPEEIDKSDEDSWEGLAANLMLKRDMQFVTYGGTYLSNSLPVALGYAQGAQQDFGGDMMIVVAQVETRSPAVAIDEDQFISSVNLHVSDVENQYAALLRDQQEEDRLKGLSGKKREQELEQRRLIGKQAPPNVSAYDFFQALDTGAYTIPEEHLEAFFQNFLEKYPVAISVADLMRYKRALRRLFMLNAEFNAATDHFEGHGDKVRDPRETAREFQDLVNILTRRINKLADPVGDKTRNVRSFAPVGYKGANRILSVIVFDPESQTGRVVYGGQNQETAQVTQHIDTIFDTRIDYTEGRQSARRSGPDRNEIQEYTEIFLSAIFEAADYRLRDDQDLFGNVTEKVSTESLVRDTGLTQEQIKAALQEDKEEIDEYVMSSGFDLDVDFDEYNSWANRLHLYESLQNYVKEVIACMEKNNPDLEVDYSEFFEDAVVKHDVYYSYEAYEDMFDEDADRVQACAEAYAGEGPAGSAVYAIAERIAWQYAYKFLLQWFAEEYE